MAKNILKKKQMKLKNLYYQISQIIINVQYLRYCGISEKIDKQIKP